MQSWSGDTLASDPGLTLFQKIMLTTDGTVTELLSLYCGEPIVARKLGETLETTAHAGNPVRVLHRTVLLCTAAGEPCLYAQSHFMFDRFPAAIQRDLLETTTPIGLLWRRERLEMHREIIERKRETDPTVAALLGVPADADLLCRTYRIVHGGETLGTITEKFAASVVN